MNIKVMTLEELLKLSQEIKLEVKLRKQKLEKVENVIEETEEKYTFYFEYTQNKRYKQAYVAKLINVNNKVERNFYNFEKVYFDSDLTISGEYKAKELDIVDIVGELNIVLNGALVNLNIETSNQKNLVYRFVKKQVELDDVLTLIKKDENFEVLDELKD